MGKELNPEEILSQTERWRQDAPFYLAEITAQGHEHKGEIGQVAGTMPEGFVGALPLYKLSPQDVYEASVAGAIDSEMAVVVNMHGVLLPMRLSDVHLIPKENIHSDIEIVQEGRVIGVVQSWKKRGMHDAIGEYIVLLGNRVDYVQDQLMMREPRMALQRKKKGTV